VSQHPGRPPRKRSATRPADRSRRAEPTRFAAYTLLRAVADGAYANLEMARILHRRRLEGRDAAFATELAFGTVRLQGRYDAVITSAAARPTSSIDPQVLDVLRLGAHQLLGMRVPAHAAADQSVALARSVAGTGAAGFVNAVLRRVGERTLEEWLDTVAPADGGPPALAVRHSHPEWVVKALRGALVGHGRATAATVGAELEALLSVDNEAPRVSLVARPGLATVADLAAQAEVEPSLTSPIGALLRSGDPGRIAAVRDGRAAVQDEGSQLVALALAAVGVAPGVPDRWLDLCAGPGGKTGVLGGLAVAAGADVVAVESSPHRADLVRSTLVALGAYAAQAGRGLEVRTADGREVGEAEPAAYARVLVDAPCTGLGALRRRPEARWRRSPQDLAALAPLQRALLASALDAVAPGGVVGYATCSPHLAETRFVVEDVLKRRPDAEVVDARPHFEGPDGAPLPDLGDGPYVQLWPHVHGTDAMFLALLRRR
jgi:16S rRNA (cytosine967-C5)-methyltransferase